MSLETSSPSRPADPFPLLRLPHELLDAIFEYAYEDQFRPKPICRALRVFAEKRFFRDVRLTTYEALGSFATAIEGGAHLRSLVQAVSVSVPSRRLNSKKRPRVDIDDEQSALEDDERIVSTVEWTSLLQSLPNLRVLDLSADDPALLEALVDGQIAYPALQKLRRLVLRYTVPPILHKAWWPGQLAPYPSLQDIELVWSEAFPAEIVTPSMPLPSITTLSLTSAEFEWWPAQNFAAFFPNLRRLTMNDSGSSGFGSILASMPSTIRFLAFSAGSIYPPEPDPAFPIDEYLGRFDQLEELHLCQDSFDATRLEVALRALLNLRVLSFGLWSQVTDNFLLALVDGPTRLPRLERLNLDYVDCERYPTMDRDHTLPPEAMDADSHVYPEWTAPEWPDYCSEAGLVKVVEAAGWAGVEIDGTALETIGYEDDWNQEARKALLIWGKQEADFSEARDFFGYDFDWEGRSFFGDYEWERLLKEEERWNNTWA